MHQQTLTTPDGAAIVLRTWEPSRGSGLSLPVLYENASREVHRIAPADLALHRIGHFGPFRSEQQQALWPRMAQWLAGLSTPGAA